MTNRRTHFHSFWLLPILVLRGLMPVGYMLDVSNGNPSVVMCSGGFLKTFGHFHNGGSAAQHYSVCPFAMALGSAAPTTIIAIVDTTTLIIKDAAVNPASRIALSGSVRTHLSRGPPCLA